MITASYPVKNSSAKLVVTIGHPEPDSQSEHGDMRCTGSLRFGEDVYAKDISAYGVDEIQCVWLCMRKLKEEIARFEEATGETCTYTFFEDERL